MNEKPLVLVHGFMGGDSQWNLQRDALAAHFNLITPNLPGFAQNNQLSAPDTINGFANYLLEELDRENIDQYALLGHSMGGMIVQEMMAIAPEKVDKLILYGTAASGNLPGRFETFQTSRNRVAQDGVIKTARRISSTWFLDFEAADEFENCAKIAEQSSLEALNSGLHAMETWSQIDNLDKIKCPTLIIWGDSDRTYGWAQIEQLWSNIKDAQLAVLPGCAHAAHMEKPDLFNAVLSDFLI